MANLLAHDVQERVVEVNREELLITLQSNRKKHIEEYEAALAGYKDALAEKLEEAFIEAEIALRDNYQELQIKIDEMTEDEIGKQKDWFTLVDGINVEMKVPRCYVDEYDAAIDAVTWDVNETLKLTHAEFTCYVRNKWDWTPQFEILSRQYSASANK